MEPTTRSSPANSPGPSTIKNHMDNNPWRSSYHHGGSVVDPSGATSYSSPQHPIPYAHAGPSRVSPVPHPQSNRMDSGINRNLDPNRQSFIKAEAYETTLGWRADILAAMAYLTPIMGLLLLIFETKNDFVRIHAYQSLLLAIPIFFLHFLFLSFRSLQTFLLVLDIGGYAWLGYQAFLSADTLERNLLPVVGPIAEQWTREE